MKECHLDFVYGPGSAHKHFGGSTQPQSVSKRLGIKNHKLTSLTEDDGGHMGGFLAEKVPLTRERVKDILRKKEYTFLEEKVSIMEVTDDSLLLKISFLIEYKNHMISIEEKEPIIVSLKDFRVEDWGDGVRKLADIE